ncbi:MAG: NTP transferase domain-containing protein [Methanomicrobiaceae archaeon]|nr:NTP transferase domain-containing protein [Methanomicrobiaceae archaeon]
MLALIMAGGGGTRLGMGEKPLVTICGRPMVRYVIEAFEQAGHEAVVVASPKTPFTRNWCTAHSIPFIAAEGRGYVEDLVEAVEELGECAPLFTCVSDLPCLTSGIIARIGEEYARSGNDALSTWVPLSICRQYTCRTSYVEAIGGREVCPAGINVLRGEYITEEQDEYRLVITERRIAFNVNTREELQAVRQYLCR